MSFRLCLLSLLLLVGCTVDERGITFHRWHSTTEEIVQPKPPTPVPDERIAQGQMRVLVIEDVSQRHKLTKEQSAMLFRTSEPSMRDFVKSNGVKDGFRLVDKDTQLSGVWAEMKAKHPPQSFPWIIFESGGKTGATALTAYPTELLNKFAGVTQ